MTDIDTWKVLEDIFDRSEEIPWIIGPPPDSMLSPDFILICVSHKLNPRLAWDVIDTGQWQETEIEMNEGRDQYELYDTNYTRRLK